MSEPLFRSLQEAQRTARQLIADDAIWLVYELTPLPFDRRNTPSLIFESDQSVRRVRNFPANWRELADPELWALSWTV